MAEDKKKEEENEEGMSVGDVAIGAATAATGIGLMNATHTNSELSAVDDILDYTDDMFNKVENVVTKPHHESTMQKAKDIMDELVENYDDYMELAENNGKYTAAKRKRKAEAKRAAQRAAEPVRKTPQARSTAAQNQTHTATARASNSGVYVVETEKLYDPQTGKYTDIDVYTDEKGRRFTVDGERIYDAEPVKETPQARTATAQNQTHTASARANAQGGYTTTGLKPDGTRETIQFNQDGSIRSVDGKPIKPAQPKAQTQAKPAQAQAQAKPAQAQAKPAQAQAQAKPAQQKPALSPEAQKKLEQKKAKGKAHYEQKMAENKRKLDAQKKGKTPPKSPPKQQAQLKGNPKSPNNPANVAKKAANTNKAPAPQAKPKAPEKLSLWERAKNKAKALKNAAAHPIETSKKIYNKTKEKTKAAYNAAKAKTKAAYNTTKTKAKAAYNQTKQAVKQNKYVRKAYEKGKAAYDYSAKAGKRWTKTAMKYGEKIGGKVGLKTVKTFAKKIPFVGAVVGTGLAIYEITKGNYGLAAAEFASGAVACVPGWGTAASFAIDGAVIAYDIYESKQQEKAQQAAQAQAAQQKQQPQQQKQKQQQQQQQQTVQQQPQQTQSAQNTEPSRPAATSQQSYGTEYVEEPVPVATVVSENTQSTQHTGTGNGGNAQTGNGGTSQTVNPENVSAAVYSAMQNGTPVQMDSLDQATQQALREVFARMREAQQGIVSPAPSVTPPQPTQTQQPQPSPQEIQEMRARIQQREAEDRRRQEFAGYRNLLATNPEAFNRLKDNLKDNLNSVEGAAEKLKLMEDVERYVKLEKQMQKDKQKADEKIAKAEKLKDADGKEKKADKLKAQAYDLRTEAAALQEEMDALQSGKDIKDKLNSDGKKKGNIFKRIGNTISDTVSHTGDWIEKKKVEVNASNPAQTVYTLSGFEGRDPSKASKLCNGTYTVQYDGAGNPTKIMYQADKESKPVDLNLNAQQLTEFREHLAASGRNYAPENDTNRKDGNTYS